MERKPEMPGIIEELQRGCLDPAMPVDALLRRVQLAAVKLRLPEVEGWVASELNGYSGDLPDYRRVHGSLRAFNPYNGWIPVIFEQDDINEMLSVVDIRQSIGTLVDLVSKRENANSDGLHYPLAAGMVNQLNSVLSQPSPRYIVKLSRGNVVGILDRVRNLILDWAIRMEQQGIVGEGISFSETEKAQARSAMTTINIGSIGNMAGHIGEGNEGAVRATQANNEASVFERLAEAIVEGVVSIDDRQSLIAAVKEMELAKDDRNAFGVAYAAFISRAADYMSLVSPFLPALVQILSP